MGAIISELAADAPLYLYLIDEATGAVVVTANEDSIYPIEISTRDDSSFLLLNLPLIQSTWTSLKKATATVGWLQQSHLLPSAVESHNAKSKPKQPKSNWTQQVEKATNELSEPTLTFQVLQEALDLNEPVASVRGAALRELKRWFNQHDPNHSFAGLKRVIGN
ncbi:Aste57867_11252 [Aphanomyces stellatus]|uniref:Aste57867_11252 protein n=1 Tax=Aphanomyces stellatus TaxID=120398 RepID=A0A485KTN1_9STRA|nr:hypothetical protein As57867_011210 [Aphanomyces stellatus]VFT88117.1 Aste57867_11252 [Aphanomyces stellatus]